MKKKNIKNKIKGEGNINMSLYEINKNIIAQLPAYDEPKLKKLQEHINEWKMTYFEQKFYMLLCRDINYYTLFYFDPNKFNEFKSLGEAVVNVLSESGFTIHEEEVDNTNGHVEIWAKNDTDTYAFMLFAYGEGVVKYG